MPNGIRAFVWLVVHKRIMCNKEIVRRGFTDDGSCKRSPYDDEDVEHIFKHCGVAVEI